jgi:D-3-phosphoglycerate dehydrogenase
MEKKIVVHTGAKPGTVLPVESKVLNVPGVEFILRGRCDTPEKVLAAVRDADAALCGGEPYTREVFANAPRLKVVVRYGIGVDTIDLEAATEYGVMVANFPDFCIEEVANHALVLILACAKKVVQLDRTLRAKGWPAARALMSPMGTIHDQTLGLIAFGNIARALAERAKVLHMPVIACDPYVDASVFAKAGVEAVTPEEVAARSDYVSCHLPLTPQTRGMIDASFFGRMKPTAYFINTSRGAVIKEADLVAALETMQIAGAGLDVFEKEPIESTHPFCTMEQVILLPHTASYADATFQALYHRVARAALTVLQGGVPEFVANREVLSHRRQ